MIRSQSTNLEAAVRAFAWIPGLVRTVVRLMVVVLSSGAAVCNGSDLNEGSERIVVQTFTVPAFVEPVWPDMPPLEEVGDAVDRPLHIPIFMDVSIPMSGFVPIPWAERDTLGVLGGELQLVSQLVSDHLTRTYPGLPVQWYTVAERVRALQNTPFVRRELFTGTESRLDLAVTSIIEDLRAGRAESGAIITDLLGTGEGTGALAVAQYLIPWISSAERRGADLHVGLLGVRGTYWGAFDRTRCPPLKEAYGCWFSERANKWMPRIDAPPRIGVPGFKPPIDVPFYVLLFGRGTDALNEIAISVQRDLGYQEGTKPDSNWELLTSVDSLATVDFSVFPDPQYVFERDSATGTYRCRNVISENSVYLSGSIISKRYRLTRVTLAPKSQDLTQSPFDVKLRDPLTDTTTESDISVLVRCGAIRDIPGNRDSSRNPPLRLKIEGETEPPGTWEGWHTPHDLGPQHPRATLMLRYFLESTRVANITVDLHILSAGQP